MTVKEELENQGCMLVGFLPETDKVSMCFAVASDFEDLELQLEDLKSHFKEETRELHFIGGIDDETGTFWCNESFINSRITKFWVTKDALELPKIILDYILVMGIDLTVI